MTSRAGRPPSTSPDRIVAQAYALFRRKGYDATTMDDIAAAAGISRRTLFHYYATKELIVWRDHAGSIATLRASLGEVPGDVPTFVALRRAVVRTVTTPAADLPLIRQQMLLVDATPCLRASAVFDDWRAVLAEDAARRLATDPAALLPQMLAAAVQAVTLTALTRWALAGERAPHEVVDEALALLGEGLADARAASTSPGA